MRDGLDERPSTAPGPGRTAPVLLAVLGFAAPQVWTESRAGSSGLGRVVPVLLLAVGSLAVSRWSPR